MSYVEIEKLLNTIKKVFMDKTTGELELTFKERKRYIYFINGNIRYARSEFPSEKVGQFFLKDNLISEEVLNNALIESKRENKILGEYLKEKKMANKDDLRESVKNLIYHIATKAFIDDITNLNFQKQQQFIDDSILLKISTANVLLEGTRLISETFVFENFLNEFEDKIPVLTDNPGDLFKELQLNPHEGFILSRIDKSSSLKQISTFTGLPKLEVGKMLYALNTVGLIYFTDKNQTSEHINEIDLDQVVDDISSNEDCVIEDDTPKVRKVTRDESFIEEVDRFHNIIKKLNHYDILEVSRSSSPEDVKKGYIKQIKRYHPDKHSSKIYFDIISKLETITNKVTEAYNTLTDEIKKEAYDHELKKIDDEKMRNRDIDQKDQIYQNAMSLLREGRQYHAVTMLQRGIQIAPNDKRFNLELGKLLSYKAESAEKAKYYLKKVIKLDPSCKECYLFLARIAKKDGDISEAKKYYSDLTTFDPGNSEAETYLSGGVNNKKDVFSSFKGLFGKKK